MRVYRSFTHKDAVLRISCDRFDAVTQEVVRQRELLEHYITRHPEFRTSLEPIEVLGDAPAIACRMADAARVAGVGPMAAVAGAMARAAAEAGLAAGAEEAIVENGGDIFLVVTRPVTIGLYAGDAELRDRLAFRIDPERTPVAVCSSSGRMGHSVSLGACDLATVVARDASLADAAATRAANLVRCEADIAPALDTIAGLEAVDGVLIVKDAKLGFKGSLPELIRSGPMGRQPG
jgi:ApbE superfamily uncharacterized protein (UPF0280 family)